LDLSLHLEAVTSSACLQLLGKEFHTIGPLTQNACADKVNDNGETVSNTHTHTQLFYSPFSGTTRVSRWRNSKYIIVRRSQCSSRPV